MLLTGVPPVLMGVLLLFFIAFRLKLLPLGGAYSIGVVPNWSWAFCARHAKAPDPAGARADPRHRSGGWVLSMRGMGVTIQGEDYVNFAEHKGLSGGRIFRDYYLRNALLPQVTGFALALGTVVTSAIVVEGIFGLPGIGTVLNNAIRSNDFPVIYGIVLFITIAVATLMVVVEFLYPLLDPAHPQPIGASVDGDRRARHQPEDAAARAGSSCCCAICAATGAWRSASSILLGLVAFTVIGLLTIDPKHAYPLAVATKTAAEPGNIRSAPTSSGATCFAAMVVGHVADGA